MTGPASARVVPTAQLGLAKSQAVPKPRASKSAQKEAPLQSFPPAHAEWIGKNITLLAMVPADLVPPTRHGEHSYTCKGPNGSTVEVFLRHQAYYIKKTGLDGELPASGRHVRWDAYGAPHETWAQLKKTIRW